MSYILEALKKLEQKKQREEGTRLLSDRHAKAGPSKRPLWPYLLVFALILNAGLLLWWVRPWRGDTLQSRVATREDVRRGMAPPEGERREHKEVLAPAPSEIPLRPAAAEHPAHHAVPQAPLAITGAQPSEQTASNDGTAPSTPLPVEMSQLPPALKQALPDLTISGHFFNADPSARIVIIGGRTLHEGQTVAPGVKLERITPEGAIFSYQGTRFKNRIF
jgi:general secretion pathway protein B